MSQVFRQYYGGTAGTTGFAAQATQDANHDGIINASEAIWSPL